MEAICSHLQGCTDVPELQSHEGSGLFFWPGILSLDIVTLIQKKGNDNREKGDCTDLLTCAPASCAPHLLPLLEFLVFECYSFHVNFQLKTYPESLFIVGSSPNPSGWYSGPFAFWQSLPVNFSALFQIMVSRPAWLVCHCPSKMLWTFPASYCCLRTIPCPLYSLTSSLTY